jgi:hypothetical protein
MFCLCNNRKVVREDGILMPESRQTKTFAQCMGINEGAWPVFGNTPRSSIINDIIEIECFGFQDTHHLHSFQRFT